MTETRLCVALDVSSATEAVELAGSVAPPAEWLKVGLTLFAGAGPSIVGELARIAPVFLDLKLHDIPAQVGGAVENVRAIGASMLTVHAGGGRAMVKEAAAAAGDDLTLLAVTVLTSLDANDLAEIGFAGTTSETVLRLGELALDAGADGLVCSPLEVAELRARFGPRAGGGPLLVVPGIRAREDTGDDQRRTLTPREAADAGADVIVVGRPITGAPDAGAAAAWFREAIA